jgi:malate/lactate dehydrogenase
LRFRVHLGENFDVDANQVEAQVIGEHGISQVFLWSTARIAGVSIDKLSRSAAKRSMMFTGKSKRALATPISL